MIIPIGTALSCRFAAGGEPASCVVIASSEGAVEVRGDGPGFVPGASVQLAFGMDTDAKSMLVEACVADAEPGRVSMTLRGSPEPKNDRNAFRVKTRCSALRADVGRRKGCAVLDVSGTGLSLEVPGTPAVGSEFTVSLYGVGSPVSGKFVVRHAEPLRVGPHGPVTRCGMQARPGQPAVERGLSELVMEVQRSQLRNRSRTGVGPAKRPGSGDGAAPAASEPGGAENTGAATGSGPSLRVGIPLELVVGRAMPVSMRDASGRVVVGRGDVLDTDAATRLADQNLEVCADWFRSDEGAPGDRRWSERRPCRVRVRLWVREWGVVRAMGGEMTDLSRGGAGVCAAATVRAGAVLVLEMPGGPAAGWIAARVESSSARPTGAGSRLGLRFLQTSLQRSATPAREDLERLLASFAAPEGAARVG